MIIDYLYNVEKYLNDDYKQDVVKSILTYPEKNDGIYPVSEVVEVRKTKATMKEEKELLIESHKKHIDIQIPLDAEELYYIYDIDQVEPTTEKIDTDNYYYKALSNKRSAIYIKPGMFLLLEPGEIHQPLISNEGERPIQKIVIKIAV